MKQVPQLLRTCSLGRSGCRVWRATCPTLRAWRGWARLCSSAWWLLTSGSIMQVSRDPIGNPTRCTCVGNCCFSSHAASGSVVHRPATPGSRLAIPDAGAARPPQGRLPPSGCWRMWSLGRLCRWWGPMWWGRCWAAGRPSASCGSSRRRAAGGARRTTSTIWDSPRLGRR